MPVARGAAHAPARPTWRGRLAVVLGRPGERPCHDPSCVPRPCPVATNAGLTPAVRVSSTARRLHIPGAVQSPSPMLMRINMETRVLIPTQTLPGSTWSRAKPPILATSRSSLRPMASRPRSRPRCAHAPLRRHRAAPAAFTHRRDRSGPARARADAVEDRAAPPVLADRAVSHPAEALGWLYVVERATLLHETIYRFLHGRLPPSRRGTTCPRTKESSPALAGPRPRDGPCRDDSGLAET